MRTIDQMTDSERAAGRLLLATDKLIYEKLVAMKNAKPEDELLGSLIHNIKKKFIPAKRYWIMKNTIEDIEFGAGITVATAKRYLNNNFDIRLCYPSISKYML